MAILSATQRRVSRTTVRRKVRQLLEQRREIKRRYAGGLPAETQSRDRMLAPIPAMVRLEIMRGRGRRIDLAALIRQRRKDGSPLWAVVDPTLPIGTGNGVVGKSSLRVGSRVHVSLPAGPTLREDFLAVGLPVLPERVRQIVTDRDIRRRARWVGVLYQPQEWQQPEPDPAVVVEWKDAPGEFFALAVWGHDGPAIMEFVD